MVNVIVNFERYISTAWYAHIYMARSTASAQSGSARILACIMPLSDFLWFGHFTRLCNAVLLVGHLGLASE